MLEEMSGGVRVTGGVLCWLLSVHLAGCGGGQNNSAEGSGGGQVKAPGEGIEFTFESLDVSTLDERSESWCVPPAFDPVGFSGLDQATLAEVFADYVTGWMTPLHESLLGLNEVDIWDSVFEMTFASYQTECDYNADADLESLPPPEGELIDPAEQVKVRDDVRQAILDAELISEGEVVRLVLKQCEDCAEGLASHPLFLNARMTTDGVLVVEIELGEGQPWVRTLYVTPDAAVVQAPLGQATTWLADVVVATPSVSDGEEIVSVEEDIVPSAEGTLTAVIRKDNMGGISTTMGISNLSFETRPGQPDSVSGQARDDCVGFHSAISGGTSEAQWAWELGDFEFTVPGVINCDAPECGEAERQQDWVYSLGGISATAWQPSPSEPENLRLDVVAQRASRARVGPNEFARGGIGKLGQGGHLGLSVDKTPAGYWVTFEPALNLGGAMTITAFSEQMRMNLPAWLQDEIFDVTLGGDPRAQVFVPARAPCAEEPDADPVPPLRRNVEVVSGELRLTRSSGDVVAAAGGCVGKTLTAEEGLALTSDWVEIGYTCE